MSRPLVLLQNQVEDFFRFQSAEVGIRQPVQRFVEGVPDVLRHRSRQEQLSELGRRLHGRGTAPSTPWITIPSPRTIWNGWDTGLWRLFRHFTIFRRRDGSASLLLSFRWTTQSARYIGITVSGPARSACPCSSSVQRTVPTFRVCLNM